MVVALLKSASLQHGGAGGKRGGSQGGTFERRFVIVWGKKQLQILKNCTCPTSNNQCVNQRQSAERRSGRTPRGVGVGGGYVWKPRADWWCSALQLWGKPPSEETSPPGASTASMDFSQGTWVSQRWAGGGGGVELTPLSLFSFFPTQRCDCTRPHSILLKPLR